ncbi:protein FAM219A isoform X4 [Dasypus novemcinctus]|uniref:protein FAM219A isoform X4 n=2 Tax=Eutheria TaxID=9347 RepID=UPI00265E9B5A|nr:protein FAM219A isoform X4 [Dasypus novemcinctus]
MQVRAVSRTRKWSCRVTAVAELLTGGGGGGGGEARPAARPGLSRGSDRQARGAAPASARPPAALPAPPGRAPPARPTHPRRPSLHHSPGSWGRRPARSRRRPRPRPAPARPLAGTMMEEIDRFQVPTAHSEMQPLDPAAASIADGDCDAREEKQRELARKGSLKNGSMGSPVNQQPKKNNVMARTRLVVPNKGYSSLDQSPDEKPLVALDTDSDDDFDMSRYSSSGYSSAEQINQDLNIQLLKDGYRLDEIPDDEDLDLIPPKSVNPTCMCCQATSSTACHIQ